MKGDPTKATVEEESSGMPIRQFRDPPQTSPYDFFAK